MYTIQRTGAEAKRKTKNKKTTYPNPQILYSNPAIHFDYVNRSMFKCRAVFQNINSQKANSLVTRQVRVKIKISVQHDGLANKEGNIRAYIHNTYKHLYTNFKQVETRAAKDREHF